MALPRLPESFRFPLPQRFDTLRVKLFMALAGVNALIALIVFLVISWSFDHGFVDYLNRADENRLRPLTARLAQNYELEGSWAWIAQDRRRWGEMLREEFGTARVSPQAPIPEERQAREPEPVERPMGRGFDRLRERPSERPGEHPGDRPGGRPPEPVDTGLLTIDPRLMLFDADRKLIVGRSEMAADAVLRPVQVSGQTVGYLGYLPRLKVVTSLERLYSGQQTTKFAAIAVGMVLAGLVVAALLATWLTARIRRLALGTQALIHGNYGVRIQTIGHDELAQLGRDFNELATTLESTQRARQQWIADIAHELRTPLAVLRAEIEALQDGVRPMKPESVTSLAQEVARLTRLVDDLRVLSLSDLGALTYHKEAIDLADLIETELAAYARALGERGLQVETHLGRARILGDDTRLSQVIANLVQNTIRYTNPGGTLRIGLTVTAPLRPGIGAGEAEVTWEDSAPGVSDEDLPRLTERLFRVDASRNRASGGSGLGLAIAKAIVDAHGGRMSASHSPLGGLRWTLVFPLESTS